MLTVILTLIGAIIGLVISLAVQLIRGKAAAALLLNQDVTKKVDSIQNSIDGNNVQIQTEEQKAQAALDSAKNQENQNVNKEDLVNFLNNKSIK
jgi:mannitol-specific phosphotransferase system IIBC component